MRVQLHPEREKATSVNGKGGASGLWYGRVLRARLRKLDKWSGVGIHCVVDKFNLMNFGRTPEQIEYNRRVFLIALYAAASVVFLLPLGVYSLLSGRFVLGVVLLANMFISAALMIYSRVTKRVGGASVLFAAQVGILGAFLVVHGGVNGSGVYYSYPLALGMIMLGFTNLRSGMLMSFVLVGIVVLGLYGELSWSHQYASVHKLRIVLALMAVCIVATISEWMRTQSYAAITHTAESFKLDANYDQLTGLLNRRGFRNKVNGMDEADFPAVMGVIDIDHFKTINDAYGHDGGDAALKFLSDYLRCSVKGRDLISRWGGEEFLVLFPHLSLQSGISVVEQIRTELESRTVQHGDRTFKLAFSAGVVELPTHGAFSAALELADQRLYHAKKSGRNRVVSEISE